MNYKEEENDQVLMDIVSLFNEYIKRMSIKKNMIYWLKVIFDYFLFFVF